MGKIKPKFKPGDRVRFMGATKEQTRWGGCSDASKLKVGKEYVIVEATFHSWHTKLTLEGREGKFNSVCFELVEELL
jgi:hypothetical protein